MAVTDTVIPQTATVDDTTIEKDENGNITIGKVVIDQQLAQNLNIMVNSASASSTLNDYSDMFADIFSDTTGYDNTIDTGNTTADFSASSYGNAVAFTNYNTEANTNSKTYVTYHNFTGLSSTILKVVCENRMTNTYYKTGVKATFTYDDETTDTAEQEYLNLSTSYGTFTTLKNPNPSKSCTSVLVEHKSHDGSSSIYTRNCYLYNTENKLVQTNEISFDTANPVAHQVYVDGSLTLDASFTYDISFDGGTTWQTGNAVNTRNASDHTGSSMKIKLNLNGEAGASATAKGYAVMLSY